jgi:hypothetical protein
LKRITVAIATVVVGLVVVGSALAAAANTYTATYKFSGPKATKSKPAALSFAQTINVTPATTGQRPGLLYNIATQIDNVKVNVKGFPTCTAAKINAAQTDANCPKTAEIATGYIQATIGSSTDPTAAGIPCDPQLDVWNAGAGKLAFFFVDTGSHQCAGGALHTGQIAPWTATYKQAGNNLDVSIPIPHTASPPSVDYPLPGEVGSLSKEFLNWKSQTVNGNSDIMSTACSGKRNYTFGLTDAVIGTPSATGNTTVKGSASCG